MRDKITLYKRAGNGKIRQWSIWITDDNFDTYTINSSHGWLDGKIVGDAGLEIHEGKQNRNALEQAQFQMKSKISKKRDEGYVESTG